MIKFLIDNLNMTNRLKAPESPKNLAADIPVQILGVDIDDISFADAADVVIKLAKDKTGGHLVTTVNSEFIMLAQKNRDFAKILRRSDLALADGVGVVLAKLTFGGKYHERIAGVDLLEEVCRRSCKKGLRIGFLGGFGDVAEVISKRQRLKNPGLKVVFCESGEPTIGSDLRLRRAINGVGGIDILFVAFGMGRQEFWIERNRKFLNVGVFMGVGGAFDYLGGVKKRAPKTVQILGLEWFWRLLMEPSRFWRMRVLPVFLMMVLEQRFAKIFKK